MNLAAININFDSLAESYDYPENFDDPSFGTVADRFMEVADEMKFRYSIFVVGRDLESTRNRSAVARWHEAGHEIGNHSWSHRVDLGALPLEAQRNEVVRAHDEITGVTGKPPRGFIAPGWSSSGRLTNTLSELGYEYDTSPFPSWLMVPALAKLLLNNRGRGAARRILSRRDQRYWLTGNREPHRASGGLRVLPLPANRWRIACWHTLAFVVGWRAYERLLRSTLRDTRAFYYLVHPVDLVGPDDLDASMRLFAERAEVPLERKQDYLRRALDVIGNSGRELVSMEELARQAVP